jgi:hypothetical protein
MEVRVRKGMGGARPSPEKPPVIASGVRGRRRTLATAAAVAALGIALVVVAMTFGAHVTPAGRVARPFTPAAVSGDGAIQPRGPAAVGWLDGLAAGRIVSSDVASHLKEQNPAMANAVGAAWSDLNSIPGAIRRREALAWLDGLAAGQIVPSDVTSRLQVHDPRLAKTVGSAWSDLNPAATHW